MQVRKSTFLPPFPPTEGQEGTGTKPGCGDGPREHVRPDRPGAVFILLLPVKSCPFPEELLAYEKVFTSLTPQARST